MNLNNSGKDNLRHENEQLLLHKRNGATITPKRGTKEKDIDGDITDETSSFMKPEPVQLTPAWESTNLPEDELNFRALSLDDANLELNPPKDKLNIVYFIFLIHGIGILTSWNMFITSKDYFVNFKLSKDYTHDDQTMYATYFLGFVGFAAQGPNVLLNWLNIFIQIGGNLTKRIVWGIFVLVCIFLFTILLAMVDTSSSPGAFFWLTMVSVVILNTANGIYQSSVFGMAASLPPKYTGAVILGCNLCGVLTTLVSIASNTFTDNKRAAAIYYFITALFILLICFDTYFALPLNRFYRYNQLLNKKEAEKKKSTDNQKKTTPYWKIFKQAFPQLFNVFFTYFVTLVIFPAIQSDIKKSDADFFVSDNLYVLITCFLTFNIFAALGSFMVSAIGVWPKPRNLVFCVGLRVIFIPLFIFMNYRPQQMERTLPIYFDNDWFYWGMAALMALTSGYFGAIAMMYVPRDVEPQYAGTAGMFGSAMLVMGIVCGILFSFLGPLVVTHLYSIPI